MTMSIWGNAFFSLFFISRLWIPLLERSILLIDLFVLSDPTMTSTHFSLSLFDWRSTVSI